jgi:antitoxin VapB
MSLNIKDPEVHRLAQAIARATGESMTHVVKEALRERYARIARRVGKASVEELLSIADRAAATARRSGFQKLNSPFSAPAKRGRGTTRRVVEGAQPPGR